MKGGMVILHAKFWEEAWFGPAEKLALGQASEMQGYWAGKGV